MRGCVLKPTDLWPLLENLQSFLRRFGVQKKAYRVVKKGLHFCSRRLFWRKFQAVVGNWILRSASAFHQLLLSLHLSLKWGENVGGGGDGGGGGDDDEVLRESRWTPWRSSRCQNGSGGGGGDTASSPGGHLLPLLGARSPATNTLEVSLAAANEDDGDGEEDALGHPAAANHVGQVTAANLLTLNVWRGNVSSKMERRQAEVGAGVGSPPPPP